MFRKRGWTWNASVKCPINILQQEFPIKTTEWKYSQWPLLCVFVVLAIFSTLVLGKMQHHSNVTTESFSGRPNCRIHAHCNVPNAISFLLHCGTKPQNNDLILAYFPLLYNPGTVSLSISHGIRKTHRFVSPLRYNIIVILIYSLQQDILLLYQCKTL